MLQAIFLYGRHGTTEGNEDNRYRGWSNGPNAQLNARGVEDAREAGVWLSRAGVKVDYIVCDDLDRTKNTAFIIASILGVPVRPTAKLRPLDVGEFTGKSKADYPLTAYLQDKNKAIPGGESVNQFDARQAAFFEELLDEIDKTKKLPLVVAHGSNASFLYTAFNDSGSVSYEGVVNPGGLAAVTQKGIVPLLKSRQQNPNPLKDGTALSGFVTAEENRPPRECWNCRYFDRDPQGTGYCENLIVRIDPALQKQKRTDGGLDVNDRDCCDFFRNTIGT